VSLGSISHEGRKLEDLVGRLEALPDPGARKLAQECLRSLLQLYGEGLERILQLVNNEGTEGAKVREALLRDRLVRGLLLIHGLHPISLEQRLNGALDKIRPYLRSHGGDVELISVQDEVARLRLRGACKSCPSSSVTLELAVRQVVEEACPDLAGFEVEELTPESTQPAPGPCLAEVK
jgi:Fe-S cluster biogenesis protein NfuA